MNTKEVKATLGYELPLSKDTYSKEKASVYLTFMITGEDLDKKKFQKEVNDTVKELSIQAKEVLLEGWEGVKKDLESLRAGRGEAIDELRVALDKEYTEKLTTAKEEIVQLKKELKK